MDGTLVLAADLEHEKFLYLGSVAGIIRAPNRLNITKERLGFEPTGEPNRNEVASESF